MSKTPNILTATRQNRAAANARYSYVHAVAALRLAESACNELASVLAGLRPDELTAAEITADNLHDTASVAWTLRNIVGIVESDCPVAVSVMLRNEDVDTAAVAS